VIAAGVPEDLYWRSTPYEVRMLIRALHDRRKQEDRAATLRAGMIAAAVYNVHRRKGARPVKPTDFVREERKVVDPDTMVEILDGWRVRTVGGEDE
jgi:hypothetical protein